MRSRWIVVAIIAAAVAIAWLVRFGCDDAWISFNYARSLVRGDGLTWFGDHVEGYTNFLWVLYVAVGLAIDLDPLVWAWAGSLVAFAVALYCTFEVVQLRTGRPAAAVTAVALCATNFTFLAFATSGLETMLQTALITALWWQVEVVVRDPTAPAARRLLRLSLLAALAILTRMDSAVPCAVLAVPLAFALRARGAGVRLWLAALAPAAVVVGAWLAWKLAYYGTIVPNTAAAKLAWSTAQLDTGAHYLGGFLHAYLLWPLLALAALLAANRRAYLPSLPAALAIAWSSYVVVVGGDFMEFRFFTAMIPAVMAIVAELVTAPASNPSLQKPALRATATVVLLAAVSWRHAASAVPEQGYDSVDAMASFYGKIAEGHWERLGAPFHALAGTGATIASQSAGAIPYFADLPTVDQVGLNDRWVARHGDPAPPDIIRPGHQRYAPLSYLVERKVSFVVGYSQPQPEGALLQVTPQWVATWVADNFLSAVDIDKPVDLVAVPLDHHDEMLVWYLTPTPAIDARLAALGWKRRSFAPVPPAPP